jgi:hypothetical protein
MDTINNTAATVAALNQEIALLQGRVESNNNHIKFMVARMETACAHVADAANQGFIYDAGHVVSIAQQIQQAQQEIISWLNNIAQLNAMLNILEPAVENN